MDLLTSKCEIWSLMQQSGLFVSFISDPDILTCLALCIFSATYMSYNAKLLGHIVEKCYVLLARSLIVLLQATVPSCGCYSDNTWQWYMTFTISWTISCVIKYQFDATAQWWLLIIFTHTDLVHISHIDLIRRTHIAITLMSHCDRRLLLFLGVSFW